MNLQEYLIANQILQDLEEAEELAQKPQRRLYQAVDPFEVLTDDQFLQHFRMRKELAQELCNVLRPHLIEGTGPTALHYQTKVLVAVLYFAHGFHQKKAGRTVFSTISQATVSRCVNEVATALNSDSVRNQYIHFPQNLTELDDVRARFQRKYNFPGIVGCIDGTHIAIVKPKENEHSYVNSEGFHSMNVQLVCDENLKIMNVVNRFPGRVQDAHIWGKSQISQLMEKIYRAENQNIFFLLGDSGYSLRPWLITPITLTAPGTSERRFDDAHCQIRSTIERCIGVLKNRWRCLRKDRVMHYTPIVAAKIIYACCVLHNICLNEPEPEALPAEEVVPIGPPANQNDNVDNTDLLRGRSVRSMIVQNYFN